MIAIIDYGMGNLGSILNMLKKVGASAITTSDISEIQKADRLILPGVGAFDTGMRNLLTRGLIPVLKTRVVNEKIPILGICLGMQLFTQNSEEGSQDGLGWFEAETVRFRFERENPRLKIPHMGWNHVTVKEDNPLLNHRDESPRFYFVHSYHVVCNRSDNVLAVTTHGYEFPSVINRENIFGVQFHPEKSHVYGMNLLRNFVKNL